VLGGQVPHDTEVGNGQTVVIVRSVPLRNGEGRTGALVLLRDVTDLRSRDRELVTKDATIREIHHRVKNNLQTVAALLRLQARRMTAPEARAALEEAVRRVGSIALVHETLSQSLDETVDFDEIVDRLRVMVTDVGSTGAAVTSSRTGEFGTLPAELATPLAMVLTELLQNATEHAFAGGPGHVEVAVCRVPRLPAAGPGQHAGTDLQVRVTDDGRGIPDTFDVTTSASLGLSIVRTLVESELGGSLSLGRADAGGASVELRIPLG
jgi:two-component sensor histidine kinase